ncbi:MAG: signal peptidase II [Candidatus Woesearchaeota archaeon]
MSIRRLFLLLIVVVFLLDQVAKTLVFSTISAEESLPVIKGALYFSIVKNTGSAFGLKVPAAVPVLISFAALAAIIKSRNAFLKKLETAIPLALLSGGILGNLMDRLLFGYVRDFIDFRIWPAFNVADSALIIALLWLIINSLKKKIKNY